MKKQALFDYILVAHGDSQLEVAKKAGLSYTTIRSYLTYPERKPRRIFFENIAKAYDFDITISKGEIELIPKNGINTILRHLRVFLYWLNDNNYIRERVKVVMLKVQRQPITILSHKEYQELITQAGEISPLLADIAEALLLTGARANELLEATWENDHGNYIQLVKDKSGESGKLIINQRCRDIIERQTGERTIFGVDYWWLKRNWAKLGSRFTPHDLRRTAGAWLLQNGVSIFKVSKFLRHSSVLVTEKYYVDILRGDYDEMARLLGEIV